MKMTKQYLTLLLVSAALFMYSCESVTNSVPQDEEILTQEMELSGSSKTKVDVCHYDAETDAYQLITIADPAVDAHINHGDAQPGDAVPTMEGFEFDDTCTPTPVVVVVEMTACFAEALTGILPFIPLDDIIIKDITNWALVNNTESSLAISAPYEGNRITLRAMSSISQPCTIEYGDEFGLTAVDGTTSNTDDDRSYLEYLLSL